MVVDIEKTEIIQCLVANHFIDLPLTVKIGLVGILKTRNFTIFAALAFVMIFSIHDAKATTVTLADQSSCQALGGNWDGPYFTCIIGNLVLNSGDSLTISSGTTLSVTSNFTNSGTISNLGNINNNPGGSITNPGTIVNSGFITNMGSITISNSGLFTNNAASMLTNSYLLNNFGSIVNNVGGTITNSEIINNLGTLYNSGIITNYAASPLSNSGTITNSGTVTSYGDINNTGATTDTCSGAINMTYNGTFFGNSIQIQCTTPQPPTGLTADAVSPSQVNLSWSSPTNNGGSAITGYKIERSTDGGSTWSTIVANTGSTATTYSNTGLAASTGYTYRVSAINSNGTSSPSNTASATTPGTSTASQPPANLTAVATTSSQINLSWNTPNVDGGSTITGYKIERSTDGGSTWSTIVANTGSTATTYSNTGLAASTGYTYRVSAINSNGTSSPSNTASATTPSPYTILSLNNISNLPWGQTITASGRLTNSMGEGIPNRIISFNGSGAVNLPTVTTNDTGFFSSSGAAPSTVSTGLKVQAHFAGGTTYAKSDSQIDSYNTILHGVSLVLNTRNVPWSTATTFTAVLKDLTTGTFISGKTIHFNGTGVIGVSDQTTNSNGVAVGTGIAPSTVSTGWTSQVHFAGDSLYFAKDGSIVTYNTLRHTTALTLGLPGLVQAGALYSVTGTLTDTSTGTTLISRTITFTADSPITIPNTLTDSTGKYTASNLVAPSTGSYNIQAKYAGESLYAASSSPTKTLSVS